MQPIIRVDGVSKLYRLGEVGTGTISHDLNRWFARIRGKEDPFLKIGVENDRTKTTNDKYVLALSDVSFDVQQGEILGIIGKNGAGKSTLLKILSKTTAPSKGEILINGKIASLLEVGTGFHPELTGRENIFLNGAILGMRKKEIQRKLDAIVDFAGVERYLDTPVKRYSSGMYVRLAFAVAAYLEPDILIVDEVLAVGDAEFQKKCLGKMKDVSNDEGRTVLFVSHNMTAVKTLCNKAIALKNGRLVDAGTPDNVIDKYLNDDKRQSLIQFSNFEEAIGNNNVRLKHAELVNNSKRTLLTIKDEFKINCELWVRQLIGEINFSMNIFNSDGLLLLNTVTTTANCNQGILRAEFSFPANLFNTGTYSVEIMVVQNQSKIVHSFFDILRFDMVEDKRDGSWVDKWAGMIRPTIPSIIEVFK